MSIVFDRAVDYYDQTRSLPPELEEAPSESLVREADLNSHSRVLEIGIGTGRIGIPLAKRIGHLTGLDLSFLMMEALKKKLETTPLSVDLALADAVRMPFPDNNFDLVYAVHVLHLIAGWNGAVLEARRVLKPGGSFVVSWHRRVPDSPNTLLRKQLHRLVEPYGISTNRPGAKSEEEIVGELSTWGEPPRVAEVVDWTEEIAPAEILNELDRQLFSETWMIPRPVMDEVMPQLREWARGVYGDIDRPLKTFYNFRWLVSKKPR